MSLARCTMHTLLALFIPWTQKWTKDSALFFRVPPDTTGKLHINWPQHVQHEFDLNWVCELNTVDAQHVRTAESIYESEKVIGVYAVSPFVGAISRRNMIVRFHMFAPSGLLFSCNFKKSMTRLVTENQNRVDSIVFSLRYSHFGVWIFDIVPFSHHLLHGMTSGKC